MISLFLFTVRMHQFVFCCSICMLSVTLCVLTRGHQRVWSQKQAISHCRINLRTTLWLSPSIVRLQGMLCCRCSSGRLRHDSITSPGGSSTAPFAGRDRSATVVLLLQASLWIPWDDACHFVSWVGRRAIVRLDGSSHHCSAIGLSWLSWCHLSWRFVWCNLAVRLVSFELALRHVRRRVFVVGVHWVVRIRSLTLAAVFLEVDFETLSVIQTVVFGRFDSRLLTSQLGHSINLLTMIQFPIFFNTFWLIFKINHLFG